MILDINNQKTVFEKIRNKDIPEYTDTMYQKGYSPYEVLEAARKTIIREYQAREAQLMDEEDTTKTINLKVEVRRK